VINGSVIPEANPTPVDAPELIEPQKDSLIEPTPVLEDNPTRREEEVTLTVEPTIDSTPSTKQQVIFEPILTLNGNVTDTSMIEVHESTDADLAKEVESNVPVNCSTYNIKPTISFQNPCLGTTDGELIIARISGGLEPYRIKVNEETSINSYENLNAPIGNYKVIIRDENNCMFEKTIDLKGKRCIDSEFLIAPTLGTDFIIPSLADETLSLKIHKRSGELVFDKTFNPTDEKIWKGTTTDGSALSNGVYFFMLQFDGGRNIHNGQIEIRN
jgi:hypothetical protein